MIGKRKYPVTNSKELSCKNSNYIEINKNLDCFGSVEPHNDYTNSVIVSESETIQPIDNQNQLQENKYAPTSKSKISVLPQGVDMRSNSSPQRGEEAILSEQERTLGVQVRGEINSENTFSKELPCNNFNYIETNKKLDCFGSGEPHNDDTNYVILSDSERSHKRGDFTNFAILRCTQNDETKPVIVSESETIQSIVNQNQLQGNKYAPSSKSKISVLPQGVDMKANSLAPCGSEFADGRRETSRKVAFTLAEILITLGVIGVVAALTLPSVTRNVRNTQLKESFKVAYSVMSQAMKNVSAQSDGNFQKTYMIYERPSEENPKGNYPYADYIMNTIYKEMKVVGDCKYDKVLNFSKTTDKPYIDIGWPYPKYALANGMCFQVVVNSSTINLAIDTTGLKGPNILGYDIFQFSVDSKDFVVPKKMTKLYAKEEYEEMAKNDTSYQGAVSSQLGFPCSYKSSQRGNGLGCAYYALIDQNPDEPTKGYWESLPK